MPDSILYIIFIVISFIILYALSSNSIYGQISKRLKEDEKSKKDIDELLQQIREGKNNEEIEQLLLQLRDEKSRKEIAELLLKLREEKSKEQNNNKESNTTSPTNDKE